MAQCDRLSGRPKKSFPSQLDQAQDIKSNSWAKRLKAMAETVSSKVGITKLTNLGNLTRALILRTGSGRKSTEFSEKFGSRWSFRGIVMPKFLHQSYVVWCYIRKMRQNRQVRTAFFLRDIFVYPRRAFVVVGYFTSQNLPHYNTQSIHVHLATI